VEDGLIIAEDLRRRCEALGYAVTAIAATGEDAIFLAERSRPDLVLMDIRLRGTMDGIEAARQIRANLNIPIIYATSSSDEATLVRARETEPYGYLLKPVEPRELRATIELALYRRSRETEQRRTYELSRALINAYTEPVLLMDLDGTITGSNGAADAILGGYPNAGRSRCLLDFIPPEERQTVATDLSELRSGSQSRETRMTCTLLGVDRTRVSATLTVRTLRDKKNVPQAFLAIVQPSARTVKRAKASAAPV
jgi:CheY-like chemotaxis protein